MLSVLLFFSFFFLLHSEEIFHTMYNFFGLLKKKLYFFAIKIRKKKSSWGIIPHILIIKTVWQEFLKNYIYAIRLWWQKYVFLSTVIVPSPFTMHKKGF